MCGLGFEFWPENPIVETLVKLLLCFLPMNNLLVHLAQKQYMSLCSQYDLSTLSHLILSIIHEHILFWFPYNKRFKHLSFGEPLFV